MKGTQGLMIAAGLGIAGAVCNWFYVDKLARGYEKVSFIAINPDPNVQIELGDRFREEHLQRVDIPQRFVDAGNLKAVAVPWELRSTVIGESATKNYGGGELVLQQDVVTPPARDPNELLGENEVLLWLPVNPQNVVPELVNPGDMISFDLPAGPGNPRGGSGSSNDGAGSGESRIVGPFRVLALGSRTGSRDVARAAGRSASRENTIAIAAKLEDDRLEPKAQMIVDRLRRTNFQQAVLLLHSKGTRENEDGQ